MGLICSRIGNAVTNHIGGSSIPLDPGMMRGSRMGAIGNWQTWNHEYLSKPLGRNDQYALLMPMEYGGMACDMVGINTLSGAADLLVDMHADLVGSHSMGVSTGGMTVLWDMACDMIGVNTMTSSAELALDMRCAMVVNLLTAGDVEGATLDATITGDTSLREAILTILEFAQSGGSGGSGDPVEEEA